MSAWDRAEDAADIPWWHKVLVGAGYAVLVLVASAIVSHLEVVLTFPWLSVLNNGWTYGAVTAALILASHRTPPLIAHLLVILSAVSLGLWMGATKGFWPSVAFIAILGIITVAWSFARTLFQAWLRSRAK